MIVLVDLAILIPGGRVREARRGSVKSHLRGISVHQQNLAFWAMGDLLCSKNGRQSTTYLCKIIKCAQTLF